LVAAYLVTALASGLAVSMALSVNRLVNLWQRGLATPQDLFTEPLLLCALVTAYAAVPAAVAIGIAEQRRTGGYGYFAAAVGAVLPLLVLGRRAEWSLMCLGVALGLAAGCLYRRLAGTRGGPVTDPGAW